MADNKLPELTRNDLALALFGVQHMQGWWKAQPKCDYQRKELEKARALNRKLTGILDQLSAPYCEDEPDFSSGDEPVYAPNAEAARLQIEARATVERRIREGLVLPLPGEEPDEDIDTSDIPEADEEWFKRAKLVLPDKSKP